MLLFDGCQNSTALNSLHYSIRSRVEVYFVDVCGYDTRRAGLPGIAAGSSAGTVFTKMSSIQSMYPYYCIYQSSALAVDEHEHSPARICTTLSLYTTSRTTDRYRTDAVVCCVVA